MCKNICNCSFCRKRAGRAPLGQISEMARRKGFKSVHHFLMEHEGFDIVEEEDREPPKRKLRNESKENEHDSASEEVDRKPRNSGLV
jgi:cell division cycle-associated protein 7